MVDYNRAWGLKEYLSPVNHLFCVYRWQAPLIKQFYPNTTTVDTTTSSTLLSTTTGFAASIF